MDDQSLLSERSANVSTRTVAEAGRPPATPGRDGDAPRQDRAGAPNAVAEAPQREKTPQRETTQPDPARGSLHQPDERGPQPETDRQRQRGFLQRRPLTVLLAFVLIIGAATAGYFYWQYTKHFEETDDAFIDSRPFGLAPKVGGYITQVLVNDNQHIDANATVMRIDRRDYEASLEQSEAQVASAEAQIAIYDGQIAAQAAQIDQANAQIRQAQAALQFAEADFKRYQQLASKGAGTIQRSQQSTSDQTQRQADLARAKATLAAAQLQVNVLKAQRKSAMASRAQNAAQLTQAKLNLDQTAVKTLQSGTVSKLSAAVGQYAQPGTTALMLVPDTVWVTANFKETQLTDMRPGQEVELSIDAYPAQAVRGRVESIQRGSGSAFSLLPSENATGNYVKVVQRVPVKIAVDRWPSNIAIGPGMSVLPKVRVR